MSSSKHQTGFTIVELLIVIVVIAGLASISVVAYTGIQTRAKNSGLQSTISGLYRAIEAYKALNGTYPATRSSDMGIGGGSSVPGTIVNVDLNCPIVSNSTTVKTALWIPDIDNSLPLSNGEIGAKKEPGCFVYQSNGDRFILSAWNMVAGDPQTDSMYRRLGIRELRSGYTQWYMCNNNSVGSVITGNDYYKKSYTISNITNCNETPPA